MPGNNLILLSQPQGQIVDKIVVCVPVTPAHGAVARPPSQVITTTKQTQGSLFLLDQDFVHLPQNDLTCDGSIC